MNGQQSFLEKKAEEYRGRLEDANWDEKSGALMVLSGAVEIDLVYRIRMIERLRADGSLDLKSFADECKEMDDGLLPKAYVHAAEVIDGYLKG